MTCIAFMSIIYVGSTHGQASARGAAARPSKAERCAAEGADVIIPTYGVPNQVPRENGVREVAGTMVLEIGLPPGFPRPNPSCNRRP